MYFELLKTAHHYPKVWGSVGVGKVGPNGEAGDRKEIIVILVAKFYISSWGGVGSFWGLVRACVVLGVVVHF